MTIIIISHTAPINNYTLVNYKIYIPKIYTILDAKLIIYILYWINNWHPKSILLSILLLIIIVTDLFIIPTLRMAINQKFKSTN